MRGWVPVSGSLGPEPGARLSGYLPAPHPPALLFRTRADRGWDFSCDLPSTMRSRCCYQPPLQMGQLRQMAQLVSGGAGAQKCPSPEPLSLMTSPGCLLHGEVPTVVMWGCSTVPQGPRCCPGPGIRRGVSSGTWLTVCIPPKQGHFSVALPLPPTPSSATPKACPSHLGHPGLPGCRESYFIRG